MCWGAGFLQVAKIRFNRELTWVWSARCGNVHRSQKGVKVVVVIRVCFSVSFWEFLFLTTVREILVGRENGDWDLKARRTSRALGLFPDIWETNVSYLSVGRAA